MRRKDREVTDKACGHSARFQSVIGTGIVSFITDREEKKHIIADHVPQHGEKGTAF